MSDVPDTFLFVQLIVSFCKRWTHYSFSDFFFSKHWVISASVPFSTKLHQRKASVIGLTYYFYLFLSNFHNRLSHWASLMWGNSFLTLYSRPLNMLRSCTILDTPIFNNCSLHLDYGFTYSMVCAKSYDLQRICLQDSSAIWNERRKRNKLPKCCFSRPHLFNLFISDSQIKPLVSHHHPEGCHVYK